MTVIWNEEYPPDTCECRCGSVFHSRNKMFTVDGQLKIVTQKPCPRCGKHDNIRKVSGAPETFTL